MPNCFQLLKDGVPQRFSDIDDKMRVHFGEPPDDRKYLCGWYDSIGLALACGSTFDQIIDAIKKDRVKFNDPWFDRLEAIAVWLQANYTSDAWFQR